MAWRLEQHVVRGIIQNIVPDRVAGAIWLKGLSQPIELNLKGNCYRDLAGTRLEFRNESATEGDYSGLEASQDGTVGDMTASKKVKILADQDGEVESDAPPAYQWANCLYLEWFSESNGRVLIEATDYSWKVSLPKWSLSAEAEQLQQEENKQAMFNFMDELARALRPQEPGTEPNTENMDEFQWEAYLQKSDARSDMLMELFEKYEDDPNCEEIIAKAMGWEVESVEISEEYVDDWGFEEDEHGLGEDDSEYIPGNPLIGALMDFTSRLYYEVEARRLSTDSSANPWNQLIWHAQMTVSKLIAALEEVAEDIEPDPGFVVATLKRALHLLHLTIATLEACVSISPAEHAWTAEFRKELFSARESIIDLMHSYRAR